MDARKVTDSQSLLAHKRNVRLLLTACATALMVLLVGCGKPQETTARHRDNQSDQYTPPRPSATARLAADRYLYRSEQLRRKDAEIQPALKNDLEAKHYTDADKVMKKLDREARSDPRYECLYVDTLKSITSCDHPDRGIERSLLDYESARPKSPWAHILLGRYYDSAACKARGEGWAKDVTRDQWTAVYNFDRRAYEEYLDALKIDNKLFPAYDGLMRILMDIGTLKDTTAVYDRSRKYLPKSYILAEIYMTALEPRWGGSYPRMRRFANSMQKHLDQNPRFYNLRGAVNADKGDMAYIHKNYLNAAREYAYALIYGDNTDWLSSAGYDSATVGLERYAYTFYDRYLIYKPTDSDIRDSVKEIKRYCASNSRNPGCKRKPPPFLTAESLSELRATQ